MIYQLVVLATAAIFVGANTGYTHSHAYDEHSEYREAGPHRAVVRLVSPDGHDVHGNIIFTQLEHKVLVSGRIYGMQPGKYRFQVHETRDITNGCYPGGAHFNHENNYYSHSDDEERHVGALGNVEFDNHQLGNINFSDSGIALYGSHNIIGKALVLHAMANDFGRSDHHASRNNAGGRVACGVIGIS